mgnify:CR=1 FL=1
MPDAALDRMRLLYAGASGALDAWIGELIALLDEARLLDDTLLIITADHGEHLGEGGQLGHAFSLGEALLRVPLVTAGPVSLKHGPVTSLVSLPARLAEALDLPDHPWSDPLPTGRAVAQFDPPEADDEGIERLLDIWGAHDVRDELTKRLRARLTAASDGRSKVILRGSELEWFNLSQDRPERRPLPGDRSIAELEHLARTWSSPAAGSPASPELPSKDERNDIEDLEDRMRLLGYF